MSQEDSCCTLYKSFNLSKKPGAKLGTKTCLPHYARLPITAQNEIGNEKPRNFMLCERILDHIKSVQLRKFPEPYCTDFRNILHRNNYHHKTDGFI